MSALQLLRALGWMLPAALVSLSAIALTGCVERLSVEGVPGVPEGFGERIPNAPLSGYIYVRPPGEKATVSVSANLRQGDGSTIPWQTEASSLSLWLSPADVDGQALTTTIRLSFDNEVDAIAARDVFANVDAGVPTWARRNGRDAELVLGAPLQVSEMRDMLSGSIFVPSGQVPNTRMWRNALSLPQAPSKPVLAAGFLQAPPERINEILEWLAEQGIIDLTQFGDMLETLQLDNMVFAIYGDSLPDIRAGITPQELAAHELTGLGIAQTGLPAPLVSWGFNVGALRAGLDRVESPTGRYYRYTGDGAVVLAQVRQGDIQVAASTDPEGAADILELIPN